MSATQELIAAALTAADELDNVFENHFNAKYRKAEALREACARAMVQPAAPDMAEVERLVLRFESAAAIANGPFPYASSEAHLNSIRSALLDYVRGVLAERDYMIDAAVMEPAVGSPAEQCPACNGHGMIGGPSFYAPDEGGVPCPECSAPQPAGEVAADLTARQQPLGPEVTRILAENMDALIEASNPVGEPCRVAQPAGWRCTRANGHEGPCAAAEYKT